jgi:hypothetical protein
VSCIPWWNSALSNILNRYLIPPTTALMSFMCYTLFAGNDLSVSKAFTSISLFGRLQGPLLRLPSDLSELLEGNLT